MPDALPACPVHITDPARPGYGNAVAVLPGEALVFWACGVTSQAAGKGAGLPPLLAHAPGCMPITSLLRAAAPWHKAA